MNGSKEVVELVAVDLEVEVLAMVLQDKEETPLLSLQIRLLRINIKSKLLQTEQILLLFLIKQETK